MDMNTTNPLFNDNKFKLGVFAFNGRGTMMAYGKGPEVSWQRSVRIAGLADRSGLEAIVPYTRWKGGPKVDDTSASSNHDVFDTFTWAAGISQATRHASVYATTAVPIVHPLVVAKQAATVDHISGGRFSLNVVAGWNKPEFDMFGETLKSHDDRYDQASEWMDILRRLWTEQEEFDHEGRYYKIVKGESWPKPIQKPFPPIMNAAGSDRGAHFAAKYADMCYVIAKGDMEDLAAQVAVYKQLAHSEYNRTVQVWSLAEIIVRDTEQEARAEQDRRTAKLLQASPAYVEKVKAMRSEQAKPLTIPGRKAGTVETSPLGNVVAGTPEQVVDRIAAWGKAGLSGVVLWNSENLEADLQQMVDRVLPLLVQADLRKSFIVPS